MFIAYFRISIAFTCLLFTLVFLLLALMFLLPLCNMKYMLSGGGDSDSGAIVEPIETIENKRKPRRGVLLSKPCYKHPTHACMLDSIHACMHVYICVHASVHGCMNDFVHACMHA